VELAVDVPANGDWRLHWLDVALLNENLLDLLTEDAQVALRKNVASLDCFEPGVNVYLATHVNCQKWSLNRRMNPI
jgi:hypothetical protein